jgi:flagellar biogenesis protein FliO
MSGNILLYFPLRPSRPLRDLCALLYKLVHVAADLQRKNNRSELETQRIHRGREGRRGCILGSGIALFFFAILWLVGVSPSYAQQQNGSTPAVAGAEEQADSGAKAAFHSSFAKGGNKFSKASSLGKDIPDFGESASKASKGLIYCLAAALVLLYVYKQVRSRANGQNDQQVIEVIARRGLSSRTALLVVRAEERKFLLTQKGDDVTLLSELDPVSNFTDAFSQLALVEEPEAPAQKSSAVANG